MELLEVDCEKRQHKREYDSWRDVNERLYSEQQRIRLDTGKAVDAIWLTQKESIGTESKEQDLRNKQRSGMMPHADDADIRPIL
ncbi:hypothetical protein Tco_0575016 [Tanacetum coccineum]